MEPAAIEPNLESFYGFIKLPLSEQAQLIHKQGIFLDTDLLKEKLINLYFLDGYFVEETIDRKSNTVTDVIPFKQGYRISSYIHPDPEAGNNTPKTSNEGNAGSGSAISARILHMKYYNQN